jgi:uncharacterized protein YeaO (DUF488 family)
MTAVDIQIKRVYDPPSRTDGARVLVDRIWPRGVTKESAHLTSWLKEAAPSAPLRRWFGHKPDRWEEFRKRYRAELDTNAAALTPLYDMLERKHVTLVYGAHDMEHNHARVLAEYVRAHARKRS